MVSEENGAYYCGARGLLGELVEPQLTTIASPLYRMGFTGMQNCIAVAQGAKPTGRPLVLPVRLVVRGSTAQVRKIRAY